MARLASISVRRSSIWEAGRTIESRDESGIFLWERYQELESGKCREGLKPRRQSRGLERIYRSTHSRAMKISEGSIFSRTFTNVLSEVKLSQFYQSFSTRLDELLGGSKLIHEKSKIGSWGRNSETTRSVETFKRYFKSSVIFQWLTSEHDPEVIVIDLRETITIAPILILIEWVAD